jgi:hypothetical protein
MVSKSIAIAYSYTKQHGKKHEKNYSHIKFYNWRNQKKKKKKKKERDVKCPGRWLSPSNLMQAIFTA